MTAGYRQDFFRSVLPSVLAFALSGVYAIVDGFFVGNALGDSALAAVNLAFPLTAFLQAAGTGLGMAGAIRYSVCSGAEDFPGRRRALGAGLTLLGAAGALLTAAYLLLGTQALSLFGARGGVLELAEEYLLWVALGAVLQVLGTGLVPFLRNMGRAVAAMAAMMAGFLTNVVLDWLFVWVLPWGMAGAAAATVLGQAVTFLVCLAVMIRRGERPARGEMRLLGRVLAAALSPFGLTFSPNLTLIFVNRAAVETGGDSAVACYAAVSYLTCVALLLLQGVTDGSQPLLSLAHGRGEERQVLALRGMTLACALLVGAGCAAVLFLLRQSAAALFGASPAVTAQTAAALPVFLPGLLCAALSRTATSYCYAVQRDRWACLLIYGEPATLLLLLLVLPRLWGIWGVWWAVPLSQLCAATLGGAFLLRTRRASVSNKWQKPLV